MSTNQFIAVLFKFINFAAVIGVGVYLYKRYAPSMIYQKIDEKKELLDGLAQENLTLTNAQSVISQEIKNQEELKHLLHQKIELWNRMFAKQASIREQEKELVEKKLKLKAVKQSAYLAELYVQKITLPLARQDALNFLQTEYAQDQMGTKYNDQVLNFMKKGN